MADPGQKLQMLVKLVDLQAQHLSDLQQINSEASHMRETATNEFAPRYFATASRDLQRAVDWYLYLRSKIFSSLLSSIALPISIAGTKPISALLSMTAPRVLLRLESVPAPRTAAKKSPTSR